MDVWRLGDVVVDLDTQRVERDSSVVRLSPRATAVLRALIACGNRPLARESALDQIWANVATGDEVLSKAINELRQALGDTDARARRFIETIPKSGYRLVCAVQRASIDSVLASADDAATPGAAPAQQTRDRGVPADPQPDETVHDEPAPSTLPHTATPEAAGIAESAATRVPPDAAALAAYADAITPRWRGRRLLIVALVVAVAGLVIGLRQIEREPSTLYSATALRSALQTPPQVLAAADAYVGYVDITPDGRRALYAAPSDGSIRLVSQAVDGGDATRVSQADKGAEFAPAISHDGHLAAYQYFSGSDCRIRLHRFADGNERDLGACSLRFAEWMEFTLAADAILVPRMRPGEDGMSLQRIELANGQVTPLDYPHDPQRSDVQARHSPDGRWLAVRRGPQPHSSLWLIDRRNGGQRELVDDGSGLDGFSWLPDSHGVLIGVAFGADAGLWRVDARDGWREFLGQRGATCPVVARADGTLLFTQGPRRFGLARVHVDTRVESDPAQPFAAATGNDWFPRLSSDARQLAFLSDRDGPVAVYVAPRTGGAVLRLPDVGGAVAQSTPAFSADGERVLVIMRSSDGALDLYESAIAQPAWARLGQRRDIEEAVVSDDNHWIYYVARDAQTRVLWRRSRETGSEQPVASGLARGPIHVDSRGGVFYIDLKRQALMRYSDSDGRSEKWLDDMGYWNAYAWTVAQDRVYVLLEPAGSDFGLYVTAPGQAPQWLEPMDGVAALGLAMAPDQSELLIARPPRAGLQLLHARLGAPTP